MTTPDLDAVATVAIDICQEARALTITDATGYSRVANVLLDIKAIRTRIADTFDPHIKRAYDAHRLLLREKQAAEGALVEVERLCKARMSTWEQAQAAHVEVERARITADRDATVNALLADAEAAEDRHDFRAADALLDQAHRAELVPVAVAPPVPKVEGVVFRETWHARVVDFAELVRAAATNSSWLALLKPDTAALNAQARSLRARLRIPGVVAEYTRDVAASGKR